MKFIYPLWLTEIRQTIRHQPECQIPPSHRRQARSYSARCGRYSEHAAATAGGIGRRNMDAALCRALDQYRGSAGRSCLSWRSGCGTSFTKKHQQGHPSSRQFCGQIFPAASLPLWPSVLTTIHWREEEDVTDFYLRLMDARSSIPDPTESSPAVRTSRGNKNGYKTLHLALQCLKDFHQTINAAFGVETQIGQKFFRYPACWYPLAASQSWSTRINVLVLRPFQPKHPWAIFNARSSIR